MAITLNSIFQFFKTGTEDAKASKQSDVPETPTQYLKLIKMIMEQALEKTSKTCSTPPKFNDGQCKYLADKLAVTVDRAYKFLELFNSEYEKSFAPEDQAEFLEIFKLLHAFAMEAASFIQECCQDAWIQAAVKLTNVSEHVSTIGFNLKLCEFVFKGSRKRGVRESSLSVTELVDIVDKEEDETVQGIAKLDKDELLTRLSAEVQSLRLKVQAQPTTSSTAPIQDIKTYQLASRLLKRLEPIPAALLLGSIAEEEDSNVTEEVRLDRGAAGIVYKADWHGAKVAKKKIAGRSFSIIENEVRILAQMSHPNVATLLCYTETICYQSIVTKLMDKDLFNLIQERLECESEKKRKRGEDDSAYPFTLLVAVDIMLQLAGGMYYVHRMGVGHRDLKSPNILVRYVPKSEYVLVEITDFGESKMKKNDETCMNPNTGSVRWMAPELIKPKGSPSEEKKPYHEVFEKVAKCDVYSFAMVCYEILSGNLPFFEIPSSDPRKIKESIKNGSRPSLPDQCPIKLKDLIKECWSSEPETRYCFGDVCKQLRYLKYELLMTCAWGKISTLNHLPIEPTGKYDVAEASTRRPSWSMIEKTSEDYARIQRTIEMKSQTGTSNVPRSDDYEIDEEENGRNRNTTSLDSDSRADHERQQAGVSDEDLTARDSWSLFHFLIGLCCSGASSSSPNCTLSPSSSPSWYYSARIQCLIEEGRAFRSKVETEIEFPKDEWSEVSDAMSQIEQEVENMNRIYFEELKRRKYVLEGDEIVVKQRTDDDDEEQTSFGFFQEFDWLVLGMKFAEGGQANIYEASGEDGRKYVAKVFKPQYLLQDIEKQIPPALLHRFQGGPPQEPPFSLTLGMTWLKDLNRCAIVMHRKWGDLRSLLDLRMMQSANQGSPFTTDQVLKMMFGIAKDMITLHSQHSPILHNDLKAANVLVEGSQLPSLDGGFQVTVSDFECSQGVIGTGFWRAPELLQQWKYRVPISKLVFTKKSNVYSYSMTCYELVTGRIPFEDHPVIDYHIVLDGARPELPPNLDPVIENIITSCWDPIPSRRPSFEDIVKNLQPHITEA